VDPIHSNVATGNITNLADEFESCGNDEKKLNESLIRFCSSVIVKEVQTLKSEVQTLKSEVEILKRSLEEEKEARKAGDALGGEAVLQVQAILELEGKQRATSESKLKGQFKSAFSSLYDEVSNLKRGTRDVGTSKDFQTLDREIRHRFDELSKLVQINQRNTHEHNSARLSEIMRRLEDECEKRQMEIMSIHQELTTLSESRLAHVNQRNTYEHYSARLSEIVRRLEDEREERQTEVRSIHQELTTLAEQTEEEASQLWEALQSHHHDIMIEEIQAMVNKAGTKSPRTPRKTHSNHPGKSSITTGRGKLCQTDGKGAH